MEVEFLTLIYKELNIFLKELKQQGLHNIAENRAKHLTGKKRWQAFVQNYEQFRDAAGRWPVTYEIIYGHAFAPAVKQYTEQKGSETVSYVSVNAIKKT